MHGKKVMDKLFYFGEFSLFPIKYTKNPLKKIENSFKTPAKIHMIP